VKVLRDLVLKFWNPSIFGERLKLESSNLPHKLDTGEHKLYNAKLYQKGLLWGHVTYFLNFATPPYLGNGWS